VQSVIPLPDGSGLRLTTAKYFTPSGVCINGIGITPDVVVEAGDKEDKAKEAGKENTKASDKDLDAIFADVEHQEEKSEVLPQDKKKQLEQKKKDREDNQLQSAVNVIKGIKIDRKFQHK